MPSRTLPELLKKRHGKTDRWRVRVMALDPGSRTTGWALFADGLLLNGGQCPAHAEEGMVEVRALLDEFKPAVLVVEQYRIYADKAASHTNSTLPVSQLIGAVRLMALDRNIPVVFQSAAEGKGFWSDTLLKRFGLWNAGLPHMMDAVRHCCHFLLFRV